MERLLNYRKMLSDSYNITIVCHELLKLSTLLF